MLMVSLLNHEYCQGSRSGCERPENVPVIAIQYQALVRLTTAAETLFLHCPSEMVFQERWGSNLQWLGTTAAVQEVAWQKGSLLNKLRQQGSRTVSMV